MLLIIRLSIFVYIVRMFIPDNNTDSKETAVIFPTAKRPTNTSLTLSLNIDIKYIDRRQNR